MGRREGWGLSPVGWGLVHAIAVVELASIVGWWPPLGTLGMVRVPASVAPGLVLLAVSGWRLFARRWVVFFLWAGALAAVPAWAYPELFGGPSGLFGFAIAALHEEVVFRAVFPLIVWRAFTWGGVGPRWTRVGAVVLPAALFACLPNHLAQADNPLGVVPFFTFAVFLGLLVRRPDILPAAALAHLTVNLLTVPVLYGVVNPLARSLSVAALLAGFALLALSRPAAGSAPEPEREGDGIPAGGASVRSWDPTI